MSRIIPWMLALTLLISSGVVHGLWTDRWQSSPDLLLAGESLAELPVTIGSWKSLPHEQDPETLAMTGATAHYSRTFIDPSDGTRVLVILLVGKPARMSVHRPEHCYTAAGYELTGKPQSIQLQLNDGNAANFKTGLFRREEASGTNQMLIYWSFFASGRWLSPANPRWTFAGERVLYKLYVVRSVADSARAESTDPCVRLLDQLLPILDQRLWQE